MNSGPKTIKGKSHSSQNALRHGLSSSLEHNANYETLLKSLALKILGDRGDPKFLGLACGIAEALLEINRIRRIGYNQSNLSFERHHAESTMRREYKSFDAQSNRYLSRAYGRLRSRIRKLDHAMLSQNQLDFKSHEWVSFV